MPEKRGELQINARQLNEHLADLDKRERESQTVDGGETGNVPG